MIKKDEYNFTTLKLCIDSLIAKKYITNTELIKELENMITILNKGNMIPQNLNRLQEINNQLYEKHGADQNIINLQVEINKIRNFYDIPDPAELTKYSDGYFAQ